MNFKNSPYVIWPLILRFDIAIHVLNLWTSLNGVYELVRTIGRGPGRLWWVLNKFENFGTLMIFCSFNSVDNTFWNAEVNPQVRRQPPECRDNSQSMDHTEGHNRNLQLLYLLIYEGFGDDSNIKVVALCVFRKIKYFIIWNFLQNVMVDIL